MIRVISLVLSAGTANVVTLQSDTTNLSSFLYLPAEGTIVLQPNLDGYWQTAANEALKIDLSGATTVGYNINYQLTQV